MGKQKKQDVLVINTTGNIGQNQLPTDDLYVADYDSRKAWELDYNQMSKDERTGRYVQVVSVLSKNPIKIFPNRPSLGGQPTDIIAGQKEDEALAAMTEESQKSSMLLWIAIICVVLLLLIGIIVLVNMKG